MHNNLVIYGRIAHNTLIDDGRRTHLNEDSLVLKSQLIDIENQDIGQLKRKNLVKLIDQMLYHVGSIDSQLRDQLILPTFLKLIDGDILSIKRYQYILETILDHHMFYKIGEKNTDSVFTRSFSSLIVAAILYKDNQLGFLSEASVKYVFSRSLSYLKCEQDTRGYVEVKGWAHSIAHGADLLVALVKHHKFKIELSNEILDTIHHCLFKEATYIDEEDERLVFVIMTLIEKELDQKRLQDWVLTVFNDLELLHANEGFSNRYFRTKFNVTNFLKSLYFIIGFENDKSSVRQVINTNLKALHYKLYGENEVHR